MKKIIVFLLLSHFCIVLQAQVPIRVIDKPTREIKNINALPVAYDFSNVKICVDKAPAANINLPPRKITAGNPPPKINNDGSISQVGVIQQGLTGATEKMWNPGDVITVYLATNNGSQLIRDKVKQYAKVWEQYANIKFDFITDFKAAKIKVGFFSTKQSWSWLGRDVLSNPFSNYTMNFGWFDNNTLETEFSRTITHEFGHAIGFVHEQKSPLSPLQFDLPKLYQYFKESDNWSPAEVDEQIVKKYSQNNTNFSAYDPNSIMHYMIPQELLIAGTGRDYEITSPSVTDKLYAGLWYPFPPKNATATGFLRTNDDCDDISFKVEYNVVQVGMVEFSLQLGEANNKKVTWWKQIGIPRINSSDVFLWVQNNSLFANENRTIYTIPIPFGELDINKGISFWKAKLLGVHTLLNYKWNVLPAIRGGCRITLLWNRETCN